MSTVLGNHAEGTGRTISQRLCMLLYLRYCVLIVFSETLLNAHYTELWHQSAHGLARGVGREASAGSLGHVASAHLIYKKNNNDINRKH